MKGKPLNDAEVTLRLLKEFPDRVIVNLSSHFKNNNSILQYLKRQSKRAGVTVEEYLIRLGFEFRQQRDYTHFIDRLLFMYPDRVIRDNLTSLPFYSSINNVAHSLKVKPAKLICSLGFRIKKERRSRYAKKDL